MSNINIDRNSPGAVFVGNISYDTSEAQLRLLMQEVGPIKAIKLVLNRDTGQHRGYGFVEFHTEAVAKSAMQNLAGRDLMGRKIRVDSANTNSSSAKPRKTGHGNGGHGGGGGGGDFGGGDFGSGGGRPPPSQAPPRQLPHQVVAGPSQHEAVRSALQQMSVYQIYDVLKQMKALCQEKPQIAEKILLDRPPLAQALLQAQQMFGMVHETVDGLDLPSAAPPPQARSASAQRAPLPPQSSLDRGGGNGPNSSGGRPPSTFGGTVPVGHPPLLSSLPPALPPQLPPRSQLPSQPPPMVVAPPGTRIIQGFDNPVPEHLIQQALSLLPEQIAGLTTAQQQQINFIRHAVQQQQFAPPPGGGQPGYNRGYR